MTVPVVQGYVLAGGESTRMQRDDLPRDKALLVLDGWTLLERALATLAQVCPDPRILCGSVERCSRFGHFGPTVPDRVLHAGPLGGLLAAVLDARDRGAEWSLVTPVDLPGMSVALLDALAGRALVSGAAVVCLHVAARVQPLPVMIHTDALPFLTQALQSGNYKLRPALEAVGEQCRDGSGLLLVDADSLCLLPAGAGEVCFQNLNLPEDFEAARKDETLRSGPHQSKHGG